MGRLGSLVAWWGDAEGREDEFAELQTPRWQARTWTAPGRLIPCLCIQCGGRGWGERKLIRSPEITCGLGPGLQLRTLSLDGSFIHSKACIKGFHCVIIVIIHNVQTFIIKTGGNRK